MATSSDCPCLEHLRSQWDGFLSPQNISSGLCNFLDDSRREFSFPELICPIPPNYGLSCGKHESLTRRSCQNTTSHSIPDYCSLEWCYVDKDKCFHSNHTYFEDRDFPGFYYSYATCSGSTSFDSFGEQKSNTLYGADLTVVLPEYVFPYSFINEPNNSYPVFGNLQGAIIEYLDIIRREKSINSLSYVIRSGGSRKRKPDSNYTAAVNDVYNHLADIGGGVFLVTAERLNLAHFTVPLISSTLYLYETKKSTVDFSSAVQNTLRPFSNYLWLVLLLCVIVVGIVNVFSSNTRSHSEWHRILYGNQRESSSRFQRTKAALRVYVSSANESFIDYFGQASDTRDGSTFSHKILLAGFGFFILVVSNTYTANLARFLTTKDFERYVRSMEEAIESNLKICLQSAVNETIVSDFPTLKEKNKICLNLLGYEFLSEATNMLKIGKCDVIIADELDVQLMKLNEQEEFC